MEEIFQILATAIVDLILEEDFMSVTLKIKRLEKNVGFQGFYFTSDNERKSLEVWDFEFETDLIHKLYEITQNNPLEHKNWNRAIFTLYPDNQFNMEYIWDQELQDEVDGYNKENPV